MTITFQRPSKPSSVILSMTKINRNVQIGQPRGTVLAVPNELDSSTHNPTRPNVCQGNAGNKFANFTFIPVGKNHTGNWY